MRRDQQIRINELLLQREELFLRIHAVETEAARILGAPFPFARPRLPSQYRAKVKPGALAALAPPPPGGGPAPEPPLPPPTVVRRLAEDETAYRITYRQFSQTLTEEHQDTAALLTLLAAQTPLLQVLHITALAADGSARDLFRA